LGLRTGTQRHREETGGKADWVLKCSHVKHNDYLRQKSTRAKTARMGHPAKTKFTIEARRTQRKNGGKATADCADGRGSGLGLRTEAQRHREETGGKADGALSVRI